MQVTIKNPRVEAAVRDLSKQLGLSLTETIGEVVRLKLEQLDAPHAQEANEKPKKLKASKGAIKMSSFGADQ